MSRATERAIEEVRKSEFIFTDNHTIEVRNAVMIWTNFRGEANRFGSKARTFNLVITKELAEKLRSDGWNVKVYESSDGESEPMYFVNIKVNMDSTYPPIVTLYTDFRGHKSRKTLDEETIKELDNIRIDSCDCIINAYTSPNYPDKVSGYLKKLNVIQEREDEFGGKYDDWLESDYDDTHQTPEDDDTPF